MYWQEHTNFASGVNTKVITKIAILIAFIYKKTLSSRFRNKIRYPKIHVQMLNALNFAKFV